MYKRQRKTSDCEADICFSGAYNEQMSCEAGRKARSADLRVRTLRSREEQMSCEAGRRARSADLRVRTLRSREAVSYTHLIKDGALYHHERFDGKGYPEGLEGEQIPLVARIICVADSFDAMNSDR